MAKKSKERQYTEAELKRREYFEQKSREMAASGYHRTDLITSVEKANLYGILYGLAVSIPFIAVFLLTLKDGLSRSGFRFYGLLLIVAFYVLVVVHELIHGITWSRFVPGGWKNIEFGVIWKMLTPYCTCREPMKKRQYLTGTLMPGILLGVIPCIIACVIHSIWLLIIGVLMIFGAGGDLLITRMALSAKTGPEALCLDHPTDVGLVLFDR